MIVELPLRQERTDLITQTYPINLRIERATEGDAGMYEYYSQVKVCNLIAFRTLVDSHVRLLIYIVGLYGPTVIKA